MCGFGRTQPSQGSVRQIVLGRGEYPFLFNRALARYRSRSSSLPPLRIEYDNEHGTMRIEIEEGTNRKTPMKRIPTSLLPWFEARKRFKLSHAQTQMARELGMNPRKLGKLANEKQEQWKLPLPEFIVKCYRKRWPIRAGAGAILGRNDRGRRAAAGREESTQGHEEAPGSKVRPIGTFSQGSSPCFAPGNIAGDKDRRRGGYSVLGPKGRPEVAKKAWPRV